MNKKERKTTEDVGAILKELMEEGFDYPDAVELVKMNYAAHLEWQSPRFN